MTALVHRPPMAGGGRIERALWLRSDPSYLSAARAFADAAAGAFGLGELDRYGFKLAASEATANAIVHGRPCVRGMIRLGVTIDADVLTLEVRDGGDFLAPAGARGPLAERGRGLRLMGAFVDEVSVERSRGGTLLKLSIRRRLAQAGGGG